MIELDEIRRLLALTKVSTADNRRMFEIYNELSGKKLRVCFCSGKQQTVRNYLKKIIE